jgi:hypothetical protein
MVYVYEQPKWEYRTLLKSAEDAPLTKERIGQREPHANRKRR